MNIPDIYNYLIQTRWQLGTSLKSLPDEMLSHPIAGEEWFPCLKDLLFHIITVEDGWINMDILRREPVLEQFPSLHDAEEGAACGFTLETLLEYWQAVEKKTVEYLAKLTDDELKRVLTPHDDPEPPRRFTVNGLLWHVMIHEMRHSAQIVVLLRARGIKPPALDLLWYLPQDL